MFLSKTPLRAPLHEQSLRRQGKPSAYVCIAPGFSLKRRNPEYAIRIELDYPLGLRVATTFA
jgi:hypothetical protein